MRRRPYTRREGVPASPGVGGTCLWAVRGPHGGQGASTGCRADSSARTRRRSRALDALHAAGVEVEELAREAATEAASETEWFIGEVHAEGEADRVLPETESAGHKATPSNQRIP